jgi:uncharacterized protein (TIGR02391 family)
VRLAMAKSTPQPAPYTDIPAAQLSGAISKLERRLANILAMPAPASSDEIPLRAEAICTTLHETYREVFGADSRQAQDAKARAPMFYTLGDWRKDFRMFQDSRRMVAGQFETTVALLKDRLAEAASSPESSGARALRAYASMDLHSSIADAAGELYNDGHYANAIEDAVKALNNLVRLRRGLEVDGEALMTTAFSPTKPILRFNDVQDETDRNEQRGFMMMFAGAVAGLRNPRAHRLIKDDPERALEFVAFVSLLAKLLDGAKRVPRSPA